MTKWGQSNLVVLSMYYYRMGAKIFMSDNKMQSSTPKLLSLIIFKLPAGLGMIGVPGGPPPPGGP